MKFLQPLFLALSLAALPAVAAPRDDSASEKLGMKLSLQCYTYRALTLFETADKAVALGVKYLELFPGQTVKPGSGEKANRSMSDATCDAIQKKMAECGLKIIGYGVDGIPGDEPGARKVFEWAKKMGIQVLVTETTPTEMHDKLCNEFGIRMALHNHPLSWPPDDVLKACEGRSKLVGSCSDVGHWMRRRLVPVEQLKKLEGRVEHLHFKDLNQYGPDAHDVPWGTGQGDLAAQLAELKRQNYKGFLSIEYETGSVGDLDRDLPKCVAFFDNAVAKLAP